MEWPLTLAEAAKLIATREVSPIELAQAALDRIAVLDDQINAFNTVVAERALRQARDAEREIAGAAPLHRQVATVLRGSPDPALSNPDLARCRRPSRRPLQLLEPARRL